MIATRDRCEAVILLCSLITGPLLDSGRLGDQTGQQPDRLGGLGLGQVTQHLRDWHRILLRYQTELDRLHGRPPCTVTAVQPAPAHRLTAPPPGHTRPTDHPAHRAWQPCHTHPLAAIRQHHQQLRLAMAAQPAQHPHLLTVQRILAPGDRHDAHHRSPRPAATPPGATRPAARRTASATRPRFASSNVDRHSPRSTATPSAILTAIRSTYPSPPEQGKRPALNARSAARQLTTASATSPPWPGTRPTNRPRKSSRHSQWRCPISSSTAA